MKTTYCFVKTITIKVKKQKGVAFMNLEKAAIEKKNTNLFFGLAAVATYVLIALQQVFTAGKSAITAAGAESTQTAGWVLQRETNLFGVQLQSEYTADTPAKIGEFMSNYTLLFMVLLWGIFVLFWYRASKLKTQTNRYSKLNTVMLIASFVTAPAFSFQTLYAFLMGLRFEGLYLDRVVFSFGKTTYFNGDLKITTYMNFFPYVLVIVAIVLSVYLIKDAMTQTVEEQFEYDE